MDIRQQKAEIRRQAIARRKAQPNKDEASRQIVATLVGLDAYHQARTVMFYVDMRSEVRTRAYLPTALAAGKRIVVPYCLPDQLGLFRLADLDELETGVFRILEPRSDLRGVPEKRVTAGELDLVVVPGLAFDRRGARLGYGAGYYDKLLRQVRPDTRLWALAFECQLFSELPVEAHDVLVDQVITEQTIYVCQQWRSGP